MSIFKSNKTIAEPTFLESVNAAVNAGARALQVFEDAAVELETSAGDLQVLASEAFGKSQVTLAAARAEADDLISLGDDLTNQALLNVIRAESIRSLVSA